MRSSASSVENCRHRYVHLVMASLVSTMQSNSHVILSRCENVRFIARELRVERLRISVYGRDFTTTTSIGLPHHVVCSTSSSSRSRDPSIRRNSWSPNRSRGGGASKPVSILPGDMKLLRDLQEFILSADLPPHQVPSTRELARRGRQDLANAVRRRGEKALSQLLSNPNFLSSSGTAKQSKPMPAAANPEVDDTTNEVWKPEVVPRPSVRPSTDAPQTTDLVPQNRSEVLIPDYEAAAAESKPSFTSYQSDRATLDDPIEVTNFGSSGTNHDGRKSEQGLPATLDAAKLSEVTAAHKGDIDREDDPELHVREESSDDENDSWARLKTLESFEESPESEAWQKAAILRAKLLAFFDKPVGKSMPPPRRDSEAAFDIIAKQRESEGFLQRGDQDEDMLSPAGADPVAEIARVSALLHTKEMENLKVSRELEEAKAMLALVRAKHSAEVAQAKQVAVEQDLRLRSAEQALHSLKLTQVDWWGEGNRVELAGSFNGWQHHAYLLPDLSSKASKLPGTRGPLLWRIELWLYPGVYEIKFIVDGKWVLDNRREVVQGHMGKNNLLYVEM